MSSYVGPVRRKETKKGHTYVDANGVKVPGVTTIVGGGLPKPALMNWGPKATAEYAVDHWDELAGMSPSKRQKELESARYKDRDEGANRGTEVHGIAQRLLEDQEVDVPDAIAGHVESYVAFLRDYDVIPVLVEASVMSHRYGYAGTLDLIAWIWVPNRGWVLALIDLKTNRSGIFGEVALQLAAYRHADVYVDVEGAEQDMPAVDECYGLHVRGDDYDLIPVTAGPDEHRSFLYVQQVGLFEKSSRDLVGDPLPHPSRVQRRRLEIVKETA